MANRPIFIPSPEMPPYVEVKGLDFIWNPGMSVQQKRKNILALHQSAARHLPDGGQLLEISSKSTEPIGVRLSAFNLVFCSVDQPPMSVECAFQGSKVFGDKGPYTDIYRKTSIDAKKDVRLRESGRITGFRFCDMVWPTEPRTAFYDWLYLTALEAQPDNIKKGVLAYQAFTDIEFNPEKSLNCQARSAALWVALTKNRRLQETLRSQKAFLAMYGEQQTFKLC
jgi:hypothetical protein